MNTLSPAFFGDTTQDINFPPYIMDSFVFYTIPLSDVLAAFESEPPSKYICHTIGKLIQATNKRQFPEDPTKWTLPYMRGDQTLQAFHQALPNHIAPESTGGVLEYWTKNLPLSLWLTSWWTRRAFRRAFLRWAVSKFNDPVLVFSLERS